VADFLVHGMGLPALAIPPGPCEAVCAMYGTPLTMGYPTKVALSDATGEFLDLLPAGNTGWVSENVARALKGMWNAGSVVVFEDGAYYHPLMNAESAAKQNRPCWADLVRVIHPARTGQRGVLLLSDDYKKRVWPRAEIGTVGTHTALSVHAGDVSGVLYVDWARLLTTLDRVEAIAHECQVALGKFWMQTTRRALAESFWEQPLVRVLGAPRIAALEAEVAGLRGSPEFTVGRIIFQ